MAASGNTGGPKDDRRGVRTSARQPGASAGGQPGGGLSGTGLPGTGPSGTASSGTGLPGVPAGGRAEAAPAHEHGQGHNGQGQQGQRGRGYPGQAVQGRERGQDGAGGSAMAAKLGPVLLALGVCWALFALAIPMFGLTTGKSLAILLGITLLLGALGEVVTMMASGRDWKPTHAALAVAMVAVGIVALAWPGPTLVVVARITAWALLAVGIHALLTAFSQRHAVHEGTWWVPLSVGAMSLGVAFWAAAHHHPTYSFAILWVALTALMIGLTKFAATLRSVGGEEPRLEALSGYTGRAAGAARSTAGRRDTATLTRGGV